MDSIRNYRRRFFNHMNLAEASFALLRKYGLDADTKALLRDDLEVARNMRLYSAEKGHRFARVPG
jgi:hypothetical protein